MSSATTTFSAKGGKGDYEAVVRLYRRVATRSRVAFQARDLGADPADPAKLVARMTGELTVSRTRFGVGRDEWRDTKIVGDEVGIKLEMLARRKK